MIGTVDRAASSLIAALSAASLCFPAAAQQERRIFVSALRADGTPVVDLRDEEFEIYVSGEKCAVAVSALMSRTTRLVLIIDDTEGIRPQLGQIRAALRGFVDAIGPSAELMVATVSGSLQIRVKPTLDRAPVRDAVNRLFGPGGALPMHQAIDEMFHRFASPTDRRPVFVVLTTESQADTDVVNPQEISHLGEHFMSSAGVLHAVRLLVPSIRKGGTGPVVSLLVARDSGGTFAEMSPAGLDKVLQRLADAINLAGDDPGGIYELEYVGCSRRAMRPSVGVARPGVNVRILE